MPITILGHHDPVDDMSVMTKDDADRFLPGLPDGCVGVCKDQI